MMKRSHRDHNRRLTRQFVLIVGIGVMLAFVVLLSPLRAGFHGVFVNLAQPFWVVGNAISGVFSGVTAVVRSKESLLTENMVLKKEIASLRLEYYHAEIVRSERDALKEILGRSSETNDTVLAYVLRAPNHAPYDTLVLDIGQSAGIQQGDEVHTDGGFVIGTITQVSENESLAELYSSPGLVHDVRLGESHIPVVAHGVGGGNFRIEVPQSSEVEIGDVATLAGEDERLLGVINQISQNQNTGITTLLLRLPINPTELSMVGISVHPYAE